MSENKSVFDQLVDMLEEQGKSTRAYRSCASSAISLAQDNLDLAAPLLLLALGAERFVESYDSEPLSSPEVDAAFDNFSASASAFKTAFSEGSSEERLDALNRVAISLVQSSSLG